MSWLPPVAFARTDNSGRPILRHHALTLIVSRLAPLDGLCVCLHALSSFQRTDCWCARGAPPGRFRSRRSTLVREATPHGQMRRI